MINLKGNFYIDFCEVKIDLSINQSQSSTISALHLINKTKFINQYFKCLSNNESPFVLNPNLTNEDVVLFSRQALCKKIISNDSMTHLENFNEIKLGHLTCSSGTTSQNGSIKKFPFTLDKMTSNASAHYRSIGITASANILFPLPLYHSFGLVVGLIGTTILNHNTYIFEDTPTSELLITTIIEKDIDVLYLTPSLLRNFNRHLKRKKIKISKKLIISIGAAHLYKSDLIDLKNSFPLSQIYYTYGLSELGPRVTTYKIPNQLEDIKDHNDLLPIGQVIDPSIKIDIKDSQLEITSPFSFKDEPIQSHDEVFKDDQGNIYILGRTDFTINFAGVNIYPEEIEAKLHPFLKNLEFVVTGLSSPLYGEVPIIVLENLSNQEGNIDKQKILEICSQILPEHLKINQIHTLDHFPRTSMGKILRNQLKNLINLA